MRVLSDASRWYQSHARQTLITLAKAGIKQEKEFIDIPRGDIFIVNTLDTRKA